MITLRWKYLTTSDLRGIENGIGVSELSCLHNDIMMEATGTRQGFAYLKGQIKGQGYWESGTWCELVRVYV